MSDEEKLPEGYVRTVDGKIIDWADAGFALRPHPKSDKLFFDHGGKCYVRDEEGTLRRFPQKQKKAK